MDKHKMMRVTHKKDNGFTLIELSIVLVVIGLIVGGVLVGRDLIKASEVRAQISQIEKLQTAVNTFKGKYNTYLPGDIAEPHATQFGFSPRGSYAAGGDGNGLIQGYCCGYSYGIGIRQGNEATAFWMDLSAAKLIPERFNAVNLSQTGTNPITEFDSRWPKASLGNGSYITAWSGGNTGDGNNYFGLAKIVSVDTSGYMASSPSITVQQAYSMDKKIDDALPQSGVVVTLYISGFGAFVGDWIGALPGAAAAPSATTCYDNANSSANPMQYSITQNNGSGVNCALSFKFQ